MTATLVHALVAFGISVSAYMDVIVFQHARCTNSPGGDAVPTVAARLGTLRLSNAPVIATTSATDWIERHTVIVVDLKHTDVRLHRSVLRGVLQLPMLRKARVLVLGRSPGVLELVSTRNGKEVGVLLEPVGDPQLMINGPSEHRVIEWSRFTDRDPLMKLADYIDGGAAPMRVVWVAGDFTWVSLPAVCLAGDQCDVDLDYLFGGSIQYASRTFTKLGVSLFPFIVLAEGSDRRKHRSNVAAANYLANSTGGSSSSGHVDLDELATFVQNTGCGYGIKVRAPVSEMDTYLQLTVSARERVKTRRVINTGVRSESSQGLGRQPHGAVHVQVPSLRVRRTPLDEYCPLALQTSSGQPWSGGLTFSLAIVRSRQGSESEVIERSEMIGSRATASDTVCLPLRVDDNADRIIAVEHDTGAAAALILKPSVQGDVNR